jgi:hypothetical protein
MMGQKKRPRSKEKQSRKRRTKQTNSENEKGAFSSGDKSIKLGNIILHTDLMGNMKPGRRMESTNAP